MKIIIFSSIVLLALGVIIEHDAYSNYHAYADSEFILECSTWYESYEITSKSEFIMVWGHGAIECYNMLDSLANILFLWHNQEIIIDQDLINAVTYLMRIGAISTS